MSVAFIHEICSAVERKGDECSITKSYLLLRIFADTGQGENDSPLLSSEPSQGPTEFS